MNVDALTFLEKVAVVSENVAFQAGVGGCETAGAIISYLSAHPEKLATFMDGGFCDLTDDPAQLHHNGRLSWFGTDGKVYNAQTVAAILAEREARKAAT